MEKLSSKFNDETFAASEHARWLFWSASTLAIILATCLRVYRLADRSLWYDEAVLANISSSSIAATLDGTRSFHSAPVVYPIILYIIGKISDGHLALRLPSLGASLLALIIILATSKFVGRRAAFISALILTVSAAQIRYAQEVREYSLTVLFSAVLLYIFLSYTSRTESAFYRERPKKILFFMCFIAPLIQYGLVLLCLGLLLSLLHIRKTTKRDIRLSAIISGFTFLCVGGLISLFLTLRYQVRIASSEYLQTEYLQSPSQISNFVFTHTLQFFSFTLPIPSDLLVPYGGISILCLCLVFRNSRYFRNAPPTLVPLFVLALYSLLLVVICSLFKVYPYGGIRQNLFLAPVIILFLGVFLASLIDALSLRYANLITALTTCAILLGGASQIRSFDPYKDIENFQRVIKTLSSTIQDNDTVYIYYGAVPAFKYYGKNWARSVILGDWHRREPEKYVAEILKATPEHSNRLWLVFSHFRGYEERLIVERLREGWDIIPTVSGQGALLYLATRRVNAKPF